MDDTNDRGYSRAPELEDLVALCKALNQEGVRYVLIGGFAVILHGYVRATKDIDLLVDASVENIQRLKPKFPSQTSLCSHGQKTPCDRATRRMFSSFD